MAHMLPADSAHSVLTCCTLCRKLLRGRIVESKNIPHTIDVGSLSRSCDSPAGRGYAREVVARGRSRSVLRPCSARMAQMCRKADFQVVARAWGRAARFSCLVCVA